VQHSSGRYGGVFGMCHFREEYHEPVTALTTYGIRGARTFHQTLGDRLQKFVACRAAERIIDMFQSIQVEEKNPDLITVPLSEAYRLANPVVQQHAIGRRYCLALTRRWEGNWYSACGPEGYKKAASSHGGLLEGNSMPVTGFSGVKLRLPSGVAEAISSAPSPVTNGVIADVG
jgi:hypothetical protein